MSVPESTPTRSVVRFAAWAACGLAAIGLFPGSATVYPAFVQAHAGALLAAFGPERSVELDPVDPDARADRSDTRMVGRVEGEAQRRWRAVFSVRRRGYWPAAAYLALVLATPASWRRRALASLAGVAALDAFLVAQLAVLAQCAFAASEPGTASFWGRALPVVRALFNSPIPSYALVFVLWTFLAEPGRSIDLSRFDPKTRAAE